MRAPAPTRRYLRAVLAGRAARHLGHNPLGGAMVLALLACAALLALSGWAATTDLLWVTPGRCASTRRWRGFWWD